MYGVAVSTDICYWEEPQQCNAQQVTVYFDWLIFGRFLWDQLFHQHVVHLGSYTSRKTLYHHIFLAHITLMKRVYLKSTENFSAFLPQSHSKLDLLMTKLPKGMNVAVWLLMYICKPRATAGLSRVSLVSCPLTNGTVLSTQWSSIE